MLMTNHRNIPPRLQSIMQEELRGVEKLIWVEQPIPRMLNAKAIAPMIFAIPWTAFVIFWETIALHGSTNHFKHWPQGAGWIMPLWGVPFMLVGLGMLSSPIWVWRSMKQTVYAITDHRAIIFKSGVFGSRTVKSFNPDRLASMERNERRDGSGNLVFERYQQRNGSSTTTIRNGFISVRNVREVEELLRKTLLKDRVRNV